MKCIKYLIFGLLFALPAATFATLPAPGTINAPADARYCGEPARDKTGKIKRSQAELKKFVSVFPCPDTLKSSTACIGWAIDHVIPLADGGCDAQVNMQWLPDQLKSCAGTLCKDRWERDYHHFPRQPTKAPVKVIQLP
jgi:hypothetical protein